MTTTPDYGWDVSTWQVDAYGNATPGLDPLFRMITGRRLLCEIALRRCFCPRGSYLQLPNDGYDILAEINKATPAVNTAAIAEQCSTSIRRDERFANAVAVVSFANGLLKVRITLYPADGSEPFALVCSVANVATEPTYSIAFPPGVAA